MILIRDTRILKMNQQFYGVLIKIRNWTQSVILVQSKYQHFLTF